MCHESALKSACEVHEEWSKCNDRSASCDQSAKHHVDVMLSSCHSEKIAPAFVRTLWLGRDHIPSIQHNV